MARRIDAILSRADSTSDSREWGHYLHPYLARMRAKLEQPVVEDVREHLVQGDLLLQNDRHSHGDARSRFYQALDSPGANGMAITDALSGVLTASEFAPQHLPDFERVLSGYHYLFGAEDTGYLELAVEVCEVASSTDRAIEFLPLFKRVVPELLSRTTEMGRVILFAGMAYLKSQLLTVEEMQRLMTDTLAYMDSHGQFARGYEMLFELSYVYDTMELHGEADKCLVQALDVACTRGDFFKYATYHRLFFNLSVNDWTEFDPSLLHSKFCCIEKGLRAHQNDVDIGESDVSCWIHLATMFAGICSIGDAKRVLEDVRKTLLISPAICIGDIWSISRPYRGLRFMWDICTETGYMTLGKGDLAEAIMPIVLESLTMWHGSRCPEAEDAAAALETLRSTYDY